MEQLKWLIAAGLIGIVTFAAIIILKPDKFNCTDPLGCVSIKPDEPIKIGIMQALTGGPSIIGRTQLNSMKLLFDQKDNTLLGHPIKLIVEDEKCSSEGGTTAALKLVADPNLVAVLGPTCSGAAAPASKIISDAGYVMLSGAASSPFLTSMGSQQGDKWQPGFFRTIANAANMGKAAALYAMNAVKIKKAAVIHDGDAFTKGNAVFFIQTIESNGGEIVFEGIVNKGETNMIPILQAVKNSGAEFLYFPIFMPEGLNIVKQRAQVLPESTVMMGMGALLNDNFVRSTGAKGVGTFLVAPYLSESSPGLSKFLEEYQKTYRQQPAANLFAYAYDAAALLYEILEEKGIKEKNGTIHFSRQEIRDSLNSVSGFSGISGKLISQKYGDMGAPAFKIVRLDDPSLGMNAFKDNIVYKLLPKDF